jgi:hypothetical protein
MSPILGILASANYPRVTNSYESIATVTVGSGGSSAISFTSIPQTYTHLQLRAIGRSTGSDAAGYWQVKINSDTGGTNYTEHYIAADGSTVSASGAGDVGIASYGVMAGGTASSGVFGANVLDILDYSNTNKYKTLRYLSGYDNNGSGRMRYGSNLWKNTNAITQLDIKEYFSGYAQYSSFALYGIKG